MPTPLHDIQDLLPRPSEGERAQLLQWITRDLGDDAPVIDRTPGICGGEARIVRTRIPVWTLEQARRLGLSEADLLASFPTLRAEHLTNAWRYVRLNTQQIERTIAENEE